MADQANHHFGHPQSIQEVETLVSALYEPGLPPSQLVELQQRLHGLQVSPDGWAIANGLLGSSKSNVRFFGALTFNIKLNSVGSQLDSEGQKQVEDSLLHWLKIQTDIGDRRALMKLATSLAIFNLQNLDKLPASISKCVFIGLGLPHDSVTEENGIKSLEKSRLDQIPSAMFMTELAYISALAEEATKRISTMIPAQYQTMKEQCSKALPDLLYIIHFALTEYSRSPSQDVNHPEVCDSALWALSTISPLCYNHTNLTSEIEKDLELCLSAGISWCLTSFSDFGIEQLVEMLSTGRSLCQEQYQAISQLILGQWGCTKLLALKDGSESAEDSPFVSLILAYCEAQMESLIVAAAADDGRARQIHEIMQELLTIEGLPELEDECIPRALEFWNAFVEFVEDGISDGSASVWMNYALQHTIRMAKQICIKVKLPSWDHWDVLSIEERRMLRDFRTDVKDLLQSSYRIIGSPLVQEFVDKVFSGTSKHDWHEAESALFCLVALEASSETQNDELFESLFGSEFWSLILTDQDPSQITRRTAIDLLGQSTMVFKNHPRHLSSALNFLFTSLHHPKSSDQASRSIYSLCSSCRKELVTELSTFLEQYEIFISLPNVSEFAVERMSGAIGVLLQALPLSQTISGVGTLLKYVAGGLESAKSLIDQGRTEEGRVIASKAMRCLSSIAKSVQAPMDDVIDVDETTVPVDDTTKQALEGLQQHIFGILSSALQILGDDGEIIDDICSVFKAGFTEPVDSIFHFSPNIVVQFFSITTIQTPRAESILSMGCSFLRSLPINPSEADRSSITHIAQHLAVLMESLVDPRADPEVSQSLIELLCRFMPDYMDLLLQLQPVARVETVLGFTIRAIEVPEPLPKRSALNFWNTLLDLTPTTNTEATKVMLDQVLAHYGPALCAAMLRQISGNATRVDLDYFAGPIRKLLKRHVHAKSWLEQAISNNLPGQETKGKTWISALTLPGPQSQTKNQIMKWWSDCRAMPTNYQPIQ